MITVNGMPDTEEIASLIVTTILNKSIVKYYGTRINNDETKELNGYVAEKLEEIISYIENKNKLK